MPDEVLTPADKDSRPVAGFFGKLPTTGDFVWRGLPDAFRRHWDFWLTRHIAPLQRHGPTFPPGGLRFRLPSGSRVAAGLILPSEDSAGRTFPLSLLLIADGDLTPSEIDSWCNATLDLHPATLSSDALWHALDALPAPHAHGSATGLMQLWTNDSPPVVTDSENPTAVLSALFGRE